MTNDLKEYFEFVFPQKELSAWERLMLLSLFVSNELRCGERFTVTLGRIATLAGASDTSARVYLRSLADKGVIKIDGYDRSGYKVTLISPMSIPGIINLERDIPQGVDFESIDYFKDRRFVGALLARQNGICFYSLRQLEERECALDHLVPQARGGDNSYRNIVCCTFEMNTRKGDVAAEDFLRSLYRSGFLSERDLEERLETLASISSGVLKPAVRLSK
jgi:HNH endonuclease